MSALVRLYPAAWRERYEAEFLDLLEASPPTVGDRLDIVRGAIDARLHPQVRRASPEPAGPPDQRAADLVVARRLGFGALAGAGVWVAAWAIALMGPLVYDGYGAYRDGAAAMPAWILALALLVGGLIGQVIWLPPTARVARLGAVIAMPAFIMWSFGPWLLLPFAIGMAGLVTLAVGAVRARAWSAAAGLFVAASPFLLLGAVVLGFSGLISLPQDVGTTLILLLGLPMWLGVGGTLVVGAAPRASDRPPTRA
jgi:hypothetical protein